MKILVTGAGGYLGRAVVVELLRQEQDVLATDLKSESIPTLSGVTPIAGDLSDAHFRAELFERDFDGLIHLAALPGGSSEMRPDLSRAVNLDATLDLLARTAKRSDFHRFVYASSIAVFGGNLPAAGVTDATPVQPTLIYGMHKAMCEVAVEALARRGDLDAIALRLPGIVARPAGAAGLKSAFMSDIFHSVAQSKDMELPVSEDAQMWMMSQLQCAENLTFACQRGRAGGALSGTMTLPALRVRMGDLVDALFSRFPNTRSKISFSPDRELEANFGAYPKLFTERAFAAGFRHDGDLNTLVDRVINTG